MDAQEVQQRLDEEIAAEKEFDNWHGITKDNLANFFLPPVQIEVKDPQANQTFLLWLVLQTANGPDHYAIAFDPKQRLWALIYRDAHSNYSLIRRTNRLAKALSSM